MKLFYILQFEKKNANKLNKHLTKYLIKYLIKCE